MKWRERDSWLTYVAQGFVGGCFTSQTEYSVSWNDAVALALALEAADDWNQNDLLRCVAAPGATSSGNLLREEASALFEIIERTGLAQDGLVFTAAPSLSVGGFLESAISALTDACRSGPVSCRAVVTTCAVMSELRRSGATENVLREAASLRQEERGTEPVDLSVRVVEAAGRNVDVLHGLSRSDGARRTSTAWVVEEALACLAELNSEWDAVLFDADVGPMAYAEQAWDRSGLPAVGPVAGWEVAAANDLAAAMHEAGRSQAQLDARVAFEESVQLGRFTRAVRVACATYWGASYAADEVGEDTLEQDLCHALATFPTVNGGSLLGLAASDALAS